MRASQAMFIGSDGQIKVVGQMAVKVDGDATIKRASRIVPCNPVKRLAFTVLRSIFSDTGRVAKWTRVWRGPWRCTVFATGERRVSQSRADLVKWEIKRLERMLEAQSH